VLVDGHGNAVNNESSVMEKIVTDSFDNNNDDNYGMKHEYIFVHHHKYMTRTTLMATTTLIRPHVPTPRRMSRGHIFDSQSWETRLMRLYFSVA
jgi:hypothetical protein